MQDYWFNRTIGYIEQRLTSKLEMEDIAYHAGYSLTHFHRLFFQATGHTLKGYIRKRRLALAQHEISLTNSSLATIAGKYGYRSHEALTRAFKNEFGITPGEYRKHPCKLDTISNLSKEKLEASGSIVNSLNPQIVYLDDIVLIGLKRRIIPNDPAIKELVSELNNRFSEITTRVKTDKCYWLCKNAEPDRDGNLLKFDAYPSFELLPKYRVPKGWYANRIEAGEYLCFTHKGETDTLKDSYEYIYRKWFPGSGYEPSIDEDFEVYDSRFKPGSSDSELYIMIPVRKTI